MMNLLSEVESNLSVVHQLCICNHNDFSSHLHVCVDVTACLINHLKHNFEGFFLLTHQILLDSSVVLTSNVC